MIKSYLRYIPDEIKERCYIQWLRTKKGYDRQNKYFYPTEDYISNHWNERFGNHLSTLSLLSILIKYDQYQDNIPEYLKPLESKIVDKYIIQIITKLCAISNWHAKGFKNDEVNIMHITVGIIYAMSALNNKQTRLLEPMVIKKLINILKQSISNKESSWYCNQLYIHNHCFHILLLRYMVAQYLMDKSKDLEKNYEKCDLNRCFKDAIIGFEKNLKTLEKIKDGSTYEGIAYQSYSMFSLIQFLYMDFLKTGEKKYKDNIWLKAYHKYVYYTYIEKGLYAYNIGDSPYNWSHGPDYQLFFIDWYCELNGKASAVAMSIFKEKQKNIQNSVLNRHRYSFLNLWLPASMGINALSLLPQEHHATFTDNGLFCEKIPHKKYLYVRYGIIGGKVVSKMKSKNIGHSYPNIGDVAYYTSTPLLTNSLYAKPKLTAHTNTWTFIINEKIIGQIGTMEIDKKTSSQKPVAFLKNCKFPYSNGFFKRECNGHTIYKVAVKNYDISHMTIHRVVISLNMMGILIIDVIDNNHNEEVIVRNHFNNHTHKFESTSNKKIITIGPLGRITTCHYNDIIIENKDIKIDEYTYTLSSLTLSRKMKKGINTYSHFVYDKTMGNLDYDIHHNDKKVYGAIYKQKNKIDTFNINMDWIYQSW